MEKKIILALAALLSTSVFAATGTTVSFDPLIKAKTNEKHWVFTNHAYSIQNDSRVDQAVRVCFTTTLCYDAAPQYRQILQSCDSFTLKPNELKHEIKNTTLDFKYPFAGYCDVTATTEAFGWQHSLATQHGKIKLTAK